MPQSSAISTGLSLRRAEAKDAEQCGRIFWEAFAAIANRHSFPIEPGTPEFARFQAGFMLSDPGTMSFIAEQDGQLAGCIFANIRGPIVGVGPVAVSPEFQDAGVGRVMMERVLAESVTRGAAGVRLIQTAYHYRSLSLYAKLGFQVREPLSVLQGEVRDDSPMAAAVRPATNADLSACDTLCRLVHGHDRSAELQGAVGAGSAVLTERLGRITGYATGVGYGWHAVGETDDDLISILRSAQGFVGLGVLVPSRNQALLGWGLAHGLRIVQQSHLMSIGLYNEPAGSYLPSIIY